MFKSKTYILIFSILAQAAVHSKTVDWYASHWLWGFCVFLCFVVHCFVSFLVLRRRELVALLLLSYGMSCY